ncbi:hypothetical protein Q7C36_020974 [Tachysurus vachellii]|uniref:Uncharacterized protein n=1 Tax=Tachysurus vachellii TaxID=175792 RepID=A0AA88IRE3_TACVA|nr:hypothetical protein Q7C36_020974 [Tachysurus vachellii]
MFTEVLGDRPSAAIKDHESPAPLNRFLVYEQTGLLFVVQGSFDLFEKVNGRAEKRVPRQKKPPASHLRSGKKHRG